MEALRRRLIVAFALLFIVQAVGAQAVWWNSSYPYRLAVNVSTNSYDRTDWIVEKSLNFSSLIYNATGSLKDFDNNSVRVIEYASGGSIINSNNNLGLVSQFDPSPAYNSTSNAVGDVVWVLNGTNPASTTRFFYLYFSDVSNPKAYPNYQTNLSYSWDGRELSFNNSRMQVKLDTAHGSTNTSGLYYAKVGSTTVFDLSDEVANDRTAEYVSYWLTSAATQYTYDLRNTLSVVHSGPLKLTVSQTGWEAAWGNPGSKTGLANLSKTYNFYEHQTYVRLNHTLTANASISRYTSKLGDPYPEQSTAPAIETSLMFGQFDTTYDTILSDKWYFSNPNNPNGYSPYDRGLGMVLLSRTLSGYKLRQSSDSNIRIGGRLNSTSLSAGSSISRTDLLLFENTSSSASTQALWYRTVNNTITISPANSESWNLSFFTFTNFSVYNRNETVFLYFNLTDSKSVIDKVNATFDMGTAGSSDDVTIPLSETSTNFFTGSFVPNTTAQAGLWNYTVKMYDGLSQLVNTSAANFTVTSQYNVNLTVLNPFGPVLDRVLANISIINYRNDTPITGASFTCDYNSTPISDVPTDYGNGLYLLNFTSSSTVGNFTLTCTPAKGGNNGTAIGYYYREAQTTSVLDIQLPGAYTANNITHNISETFYFNITLYNNGSANAYSLNLSLSAPSGWSLNSSYESCGDVSPGGSCTRLFSATIPNKTLSGIYFINSTSFWRNANNSFWNSTNSTIVTVSSNRILYVLQNNYSANISHGTAKLVGNVTVFSYGNDPLFGINFSTINLSSFATLFSPPNVSSLSSGLNFTVSFNTSVPVGFDPGTYTGFVNVSTSNDGYVEVPYLLEVPVNRSWWFYNTSSCTITSYTPTGTVCNVLFNNTGNANISFQVSPNATNYTNYTKPSPDNFTVAKQSALSIQIIYDATGVPEDTYNTTYTFSALEPEAIPTSSQLTVRLTTRLGPAFNTTIVSPAVLQQLDNLSVFVRIYDRGQGGLNRSVINITAPSGLSFLANMTNTTPYSIGYNYSNWTASFPDGWGNTTEKGFYSLKVTVWDSYGAFNNFETTFMVYTNLNVTLRPLQNTYTPGQTASLYYLSSEIDSTPIPSVAVNLTLRYPAGYIAREYNLVTRPSGLLEPLPTYDIPADSTGTYTLEAVSRWIDPVYNVSVNKTHSASFSVAFPSSLSAELDTNELWSPGNVSFIFKAKRYEDFRTIMTDPDRMNFTIRTQNSSVWLFRSFNMSELLLQNRTDNLSRDSAGFYFFDMYVPNTSLGMYSAKLEVGWNNKTAESTKTFQVSASNGTSSIDALYSDLTTTVVWYPNNVMKFDFLVYNNQHLVDPDNITFMVRDPANNVYLSTYYPNSPPSANITRVSEGHYLLQYAMGANTSTGAYLADLKVYSGSLQSEKLRMFRVASGGPYDVRIKLLQSEVARGNMLPVEFVAENKGEVGQDIIMDYWVTDGAGTTWYSQMGEQGYTPVLQNTTFPKSIPIYNNQPLGMSFLTLVVKYDATQAPIRVNTSFMVVVASNITPPSPPSGPGGGGAPSSGAPVIISNITNATAPALVPRLEFTTYRQELNVERGTEKYTTFTLKNTGEKILHNLTLDFSGIPFDWYSIEPSKVNNLKVGESTSFMVKFTPPSNTESREYPGKVRADSDEVSITQEFKLRVFSSKEELIQYEIDRVYGKIDGLRKKADDAQLVGKNVTEALSLLDESENQLGYAERYLDKRMYSNSLIVVNTIDNMLERADYIISTAKFSPIAPQQKISITTEFPDWLLYLLLLIILMILLAVLYWMRQTKDIERLLVTKDSGQIKSAVMDSENLQALEAEKDRIKQFLRTLDREYENNLVSRESYEELKKKNRDRLLALSLKLYNLKETIKSRATGD